MQAGINWPRCPACLTILGLHSVCPHCATRFNVDVRSRRWGTPFVLLLPVALLGPCQPPPLHLTAADQLA